MTTLTDNRQVADRLTPPSVWARIRFGIGVVLALCLVALNGFLDIAAMQRLSFPSLLGYAVIGPALIASLFCFTKKGRTKGRFLLAFNIVSLLAMFNAFSKVAVEVGKTKNPEQVQAAPAAEPPAP